MGNFTSQYTENTISSFTNLVNSVSNTIVNNSNITCGSAQSIQVSSGIAPNGSGATAQAACAQYTVFENSNIVIDQTNTDNCTLTSSNITQITTDVKNTLTTEINQWINQNLNQNAGWLSTALNIANQEGISQTELVSNLTNLISNNVSNTCSAYVQDSQDITLYFCGYYKNFNLLVNQKTASLALATCLNKTIVQSYASNSTLIDIVQKTDQAVYQATAGIFDWLTTIIVVIVIVGLISTIAYYYFQGNQNQPEPQEVYVRPGAYREVAV